MPEEVGKESCAVGRGRVGERGLDDNAIKFLFTRVKVCADCCISVKNPRTSLGSLSSPVWHPAAIASATKQELKAFAGHLPVRTPEVRK